MKNIAKLLAKKYLKFKKKDRNISLMVKVCFLGILIGTFSLMLTLIITNGFEKTIHEKMQGINSQVLIYSPGNKLDYESIKTVIERDFGTYISGISGNSVRQILIDRNKDQSVLFVKGIDPSSESFVTNIAEKITLPLPKTKSKEAQKELLEELLTENQIIVGYKTARNYNLRIGDQVNLLIPEPSSNKRILLKKKKAIVSGIFKVGLEEYDNNFAFTSLEFLKDLFKEKGGVDQICLNLNPEAGNIKLKDLFSSTKSISKFPLFIKQKILKIFTTNDTENKVIKSLRKRFPMLVVNSWKDLYPALVESLRLEKYVMFFILALITLVACMTMVSLLFMYIQQKRRDIAILKSMGLSNKKIRSIFLRIGLRITFGGAFCGLSLAAIAGYLLEKYPFIKLPDVYYISHLPARMELENFIVVFAVTMLLGFLATWIPAQRTSKINIAQVLRQE